MIRIAIVEDEQLYADQLAEYMDRFMKETGEQIRLTFFRDGEDIAVSYKPEYDIILMGKDQSARSEGHHHVYHQYDAIRDPGLSGGRS